MTAPDGVSGPAAPSALTSYYDDFWDPGRERRYDPGPALLGLILDDVTSASRCLDVGCGTGNSYALELKRRSASYVGVDVSSEAVTAARRAGLDAQLIADAAELPFADQSFDLAICVEVFEHLFAPHRAAAEIRRVLRPGGRLVASTPNVAYWRLRANMLFGMWNPLGDELAVEQPWRDPHIRFFTPKTLKRMLSLAGFSVVSVGAHSGRFLDHLTARPTNLGQSKAYGFMERRLPSLLGLTIHAVATR